MLHLFRIIISLQAVGNPLLFLMCWQSVCFSKLDDEYLQTFTNVSWEWLHSSDRSSTGAALCQATLNTFPALLAHWMDGTVLVCYRNLHRAVLSPFQVPRETPSAARHTGPFYFFFGLFFSAFTCCFCFLLQLLPGASFSGSPLKRRERTIDLAVSVLALGLFRIYGAVHWHLNFLLATYG